VSQATVLGPSSDSELGFAEVDLKPHLFFFDPDIWATVLKLKAQLQHPCQSQRAYIEVLGIALAHELMRLNEGCAALEADQHGGLPTAIEADVVYRGASWQRSLAAAPGPAGPAQPYHFCRAFKQSFGVPPHRYLTDRRIERAKERKLSVTEIALDVRFSESSFTAAFRNCTGETPTDYRRSLASQTFAFSFREYRETGGPADRKPRGLSSSLPEDRKALDFEMPPGLSARMRHRPSFQYGENST
jgi:AraC family transcriptional regulator